MIRSNAPKLSVIENKSLRPATKANEAMHPQIISEELFASDKIRKLAFYADDTTIILHADVREGVQALADAGISVNCIVTSPPFYGQRDYKVKQQIGLEAHPSEYVGALAEAFDGMRKILADNGSLWVNIGDTYWSGNGCDAKIGRTHHAVVEWRQISKRESCRIEIIHGSVTVGKSADDGQVHPRKRTQDVADSH
jgi:site-specific DNA-methyltransferase (cytosine-N4-specific)